MAHWHRSTRQKDLETRLERQELNAFLIEEIKHAHQWKVALKDNWQNFKCSFQMQHFKGLSLTKVSRASSVKSFFCVFSPLGTVVYLLTWNPCWTEAAANSAKHQKHSSVSEVNPCASHFHTEQKCLLEVWNVWDIGCWVALRGERMVEIMCN